MIKSTFLPFHRKAHAHHGRTRVSQRLDRVDGDILDLTVQTHVPAIVVQLAPDPRLAVVVVRPLPLWLAFGEEVKNQHVRVVRTAKVGFDPVAGPECRGAGVCRVKGARDYGGIETSGRLTCRTATLAASISRLDLRPLGWRWCWTLRSADSSGLPSKGHSRCIGRACRCSKPVQKW